MATNSQGKNRADSHVTTLGLIANSDMHAGNLSFHPGSGHAGPALEFAPAYDMLPMHDAPLAGGEVPPPVSPHPLLPLPSERESWHLAATAAPRFWALAADDPRISPGFRALCGSRKSAAATVMN